EGGGVRVCLDCRSVVDAGEPCDAGARHRVVSLADPKGRDRVVDEVWGPPSVRARAKQLAKAGGAGAGAGAASQCGGSLVDCSGGGCDVPADGEALLVIVVILAAALVAVLLYWAIVAIVRYVRARRHRLKPAGARFAPSFIGPAHAHGKIT